MVTTTQQQKNQIKFLLTVILALHIGSVYSDDVNAAGFVEKLCNDSSISLKMKPARDDGEVLQNNEQNAKCLCQTEGSQNSGLPYLLIECKELGWTDNFFKAHELPYRTQSLDLSWNKFQYVPKFIGEYLRILILSYNNISTIEEHVFQNIPNIRQLDLSSNRIEGISLNAFQFLTVLERLDLSKNNIKIINPNVLSPLTNLNYLILSENNLNETITNHDLFLTLGAPTNLRTLEMNYCGLDNINLKFGAGLREISMRYNNFTEVPDIPHNVEFLDFSGNPIAFLKPKFLPHLYKLHSLVFEDMPNLSEIKEYALFGLPRLDLLNFQGSKNLTLFDEHAFGATVVLNETDTVLQTLNLRGCNLKLLNSTLAFALENIKAFDLAGNPFFCDCRLAWVKSLNVETNAQCQRPVYLRGKKLSDIAEDKLVCKKAWVSNFLNGLLVLLLLILCAVAIYLIVMGIRPSRRMHLQTMGASSPYARITTSVVTLEPSRAENTI